MRNSRDNRSLILGIGNSSRSDDGLGWWLADRLSTMQLPVDIQYRFQLNLEDAEFITQYDQVLVIDATRKELPHGYRLRKIISDNVPGAFSHAVSPGMIKYLASTLFGSDPRMFLLEISGDHWEIGEGLSETAIKNGLKALNHFCGQFNLEYQL